MDTLQKKVEENLAKNPFLPVYHAVADAIRDEIASCHIPAGAHLREVETAKEAGVSRTTVRRAFDILLLEGTLIVRYPNGVEAAGMERTDYTESAELRQMLDSFAARLAALRRTDEELREMENAIADLAKAKNIDAMTRADISFHTAVYRASRNSRISTIAEKNHLEFTHAKYMSAKGVVPIRERIVAEHTQILEAIRSGDAQEAFTRALLHAGILFDPQLTRDIF